MEILLPLPKDWQKVVNEQASDRGGTSGPNSATGSETEQADSSQGSRKGEYVDLLEYSVLYRMFAITDNQALRQKISNHLMELAHAAVQLYKKTKERARKDLDEKVKIFHVHEGQTKSVKELYEEIERLKDEIQEWRSKLRLSKRREKGQWKI